MSRKAFSLGSLVSGLYGSGLYFYSGLGEFASHDDAVRCFNAKPRNDRERAVTIQRVPCVRNGIEYGTKFVVREVISGRVLNV